jgi:hypothetical protein
MELCKLGTQLGEINERLLPNHLLDFQVCYMLALSIRKTFCMSKAVQIKIRLD